jgi:L-amino acid N-acyltransferase YncA
LSDPVEVRPARAADAEAIARIFAEGIEDRVATFRTWAPEAAEIAELIAGGGILLVAEAGDAVLGFAKVGAYADPAKYYEGVGEATIYVAREARGAGVGRELLEGLTAEARSRGYWKLVGKIFDTNAHSLALFRSGGWREVGVHLRHGRLDGEWKDVVVVELSLDQTGG